MFYMLPPYTSSRTICRFQWIIVDSRVYDVSKFANLHPGGAAVLLVDSIGNAYSLPCRIEALKDVMVDSG